MPACEKCWSDAHAEAWSSQGDKVEIYHRMIDERDCTPEEQAGRDATKCTACDRITVHPYVKCCMACGETPPTDSPTQE